LTGLEDAPDGQAVRGGLTANNVRNKVADYVLEMLGLFTGKYKKYEEEGI
jgi:hypothetical protein